MWYLCAILCEHSSIVTWTFHSFTHAILFSFYVGKFLQNFHKRHYHFTVMKHLMINVSLYGYASMRYFITSNTRASQLWFQPRLRVEPKYGS